MRLSLRERESREGWDVGHKPDEHWDISHDHEQAAHHAPLSRPHTHRDRAARALRPISCSMHLRLAPSPLPFNRPSAPIAAPTTTASAVPFRTFSALSRLSLSVPPPRHATPIKATSTARKRFDFIDTGVATVVRRIEEQSSEEETQVLLRRLEEHAVRLRGALPAPSVLPRPQML